MFLYIGGEKPLQTSQKECAIASHDRSERLAGRQPCRICRGIAGRKSGRHSSSDHFIDIGISAAPGAGGVTCMSGAADQRIGILQLLSQRPQCAPGDGLHSFRWICGGRSDRSDVHRSIQRSRATMDVCRLPDSVSDTSDCKRLASETGSRRSTHRWPTSMAMAGADRIDRRYFIGIIGHRRRASYYCTFHFAPADRPTSGSGA